MKKKIGYKKKAAKLEKLQFWAFLAPGTLNIESPVRFYATLRKNVVRKKSVSLHFGKLRFRVPDTGGCDF